MKRLSSMWDLYQVTEVDDEAGGTEETAEFVKKVHVSITPMQGSRADQYSQIINGKPFNVKMRYTNELTGDDSTVTKNYYFQKGTRKLFIHDLTKVNEDNRNLDIIAWEKA